MIMEIASHYPGTLQYIRSRWPTYLIAFGGGLVLSILIIILSLIFELYSFTALSLLAFLIFSYFVVASIWRAHQLYDDESITDALVKLGPISETDHLVQIDLGERIEALKLSRRLTTGRIQVIDVYNPQLVPDRALRRSREMATKLPSDPRIRRNEGHINLLPYPNNSVKTVVTVETLGKFWQRGDQLRILQEIVRVLEPGGSVLVTEAVRSSTNLLTMGLSGIRVPAVSYWVTILAEAGLEYRSQVMVKDMICCLRAVKAP